MRAHYGDSDKSVRSRIVMRHDIMVVRYKMPFGLDPNATQSTWSMVMVFFSSLRGISSMAFAKPCSTRRGRSSTCDRPSCVRTEHRYNEAA